MEKDDFFEDMPNIGKETVNPLYQFSKNKNRKKKDTPKIIRNIDINYAMALKNSKLDFSGIPVFLPYEAYEIQRIYTQKVIDILSNKSIGALESPTGTGKKLSLLCSSLAFLKSQREKELANQIIIN